MSPPHTQAFEDAVTVTPVSSHEYTANLHPSWTIGAVPHGGYTTSILYRLATTHFKHTHPTRHNSQPLPISMQITFLRRTATGPAVLTVEDSKLGLRTSTIHVTLSQDDDNNINSKQDKKRTARVVGYITVSDPVSDVGYSTPSAWKLYPPAPGRGGPPGVVVTADDVKLSQNEDSSEIVKWIQTGPTRWSNFRKAEHQCITFGPTSEYKQRGVLDQWARLRTVSSSSSVVAAGNGRWTNETLPFLSDWFPAALEEISSSPSSTSKSKIPPFWYPTVTLNIDFKKSLPPQGVDWLYSRVVMKAVRNGRMDVEVIIMDEQGEIVALCSHVGLVVSIERNTSGRRYGKDAEKANL